MDWDHWDHQLMKKRVLLPSSGVGVVLGTISESNICPTTISLHGKTPENPVNIFEENFAHILFANHGCVSDSWSNMFLLRSHAAITTGNETYHHLQNITSIRFLMIWYAETSIHRASEKNHNIFLHIAISSLSLLRFPLHTLMNVSSCMFFWSPVHMVYSRLGFSQNRKKLCSACCCTFIYLTNDWTGNTCPPVHPPANPMRIINTNTNGARYWIRTSDLHNVNVTLSTSWANRA